MTKKQLLWTHGVIFVLLGALCLYGCPLYKLLGVSCPGCGLTRAWICFFRGEWEKALEYHLLFFPAPLFVILFAHEGRFGNSGKGLRKGFLLSFSLILMIYHLARTRLCIL